MKSEKKVNLEWFDKIKSLNDEEIELAEIPASERALYDDSREYIRYNWKKISELLFNEEIDDELIALKNAIPKGIKELYEVDEQGNPTGDFDWDYGIKIIESICGTKNIFEMKKTEYADELEKLFLYMPDHMGDMFAYVDDPIGLYEALIPVSEPGDLNCPNEIKENPEVMYQLFELSNFDDVENCFYLMSDELKQDKKLMARILDLSEVKKNGGVALKYINPELYADDDEAKKQIIECWGITVFESWWKETSHLWDSVMEEMNDQMFYNFIEDEDIDLLEKIKSKDSSSYNPELAEKIEEEISRRARNEKILSTMKKALGKTVGKTERAEIELRVDEICKICGIGEEYENC